MMMLTLDKTNIKINIDIDDIDDVNYNFYE